MRSPGRGVAIYVGVVLLVVLAGFVAEKIFGGTDKMDEARDALEGLPYRISSHSAPEGVLLGTAQAHLGVVVHFAISDQGPESPGIPPRLARIDENEIDDGGFWVWDDSGAPLVGRTATQVDEATQVSVAIEEALCRKGTGDPCEI